MTENVVINSEYIKLDQLLKLSGLALTGGEAKIIIAEGSVFVNGEVCTMRGRKIRAGDVVSLGSEKVFVKGEADK